MADLFADASGATLSTMIGNYYDHVFLERLEANLCFDKWGVQKALPQNMGDTVVWHALKNVATGYTLPDGAIPGSSAVSARKVSATITWKAQLVGITDRVVMTAVCPVVEETVAHLGYNAALTRDNYIAGEVVFDGDASNGITNAASVTFPSIQTQGFPIIEGNTGDVVWTDAPLANGRFSTIATIAHVRKAVTHLKNLDAPTWEDGNYRGIIHPRVSDHVRTDTNFATWMAYTNRQAMEKGRLGVIERVLFEESSQAATETVKLSAWSNSAYTSVANQNVYGTLIFGKGAYGVTKLRGADSKVTVVNGADHSDPFNQVTKVGYRFAIAAKILNASCGVILPWFNNTGS